MSDSTYYYRLTGQVYAHNKPNLCPYCKYRQPYIDREGYEWDGYCTVKEKILSGANSTIKKPRCSDFEKMEGAMEGKRHDLAEDDYTLELGEYGKSPDGKWFCRVPEDGFPVGGLGKHRIIEHENGAITVYPSIISENDNGEVWHGYLENGVWRKI